MNKLQCNTSIPYSKSEGISATHIYIDLSHIMLNEKAGAEMDTQCNTILYKVQDPQTKCIVYKYICM